MKKILLSCLLTVLANGLMAQSNIFFSEYIEGTSNNKALEIYNPTNNSIDLTAQNIVIQVYANGTAITTNTIALTGVLAPGKTFVITHISFALTVPPGTVQQTSGSVNFNGDDAVVLRSGGAAGQILDVIGQVGSDPGTEWKTGTVTTLDMTIQRKSGISIGDVVQNDAFDPSVQWTNTTVNDVSGLGSHNTVKPGYSLSPASLSFTTTTIGTPSLSKRLTLINDDTVSRMRVKAGLNFEVSGDSLTGFSAFFQDTTTKPTLRDFVFYVRYNPSSGFSHSGTVVVDSLLPDKVSLTLNVSGQVIGNNVTPISEIQSNSKATPFKGLNVITEGVVTKDLQKANEQKGFFIQDLSPDGSNLTSEGIFVFDSLGPVDVEVGNVVRVSGIADELFNQTVVKKITSITIIQQSRPLPAPVLISLPVDSVGVFERYEGMLVKFSQQLAVTEVYNLGRYGEILLSPGSPLITSTNEIDPNDNPASGNSFTGASNVSAINNKIDLNNRSKILLADNLNVENPNPIPFIDPVTKTLRVGSTIDTLTAVLSFDFGVYRLYTVNNPKINYDPRPAVPNVGPANLNVAAMNVLNFFNGDGNGGGFPTPRGALSFSDFRRQKIKIVAAIKGLNADILGMMEMENDGDGNLSAMKELLDSVNAALPVSDKYAMVMETGATGSPGTDAIKVAMFYKSAKVTPVGVAAFNNSASFTSLGRPPLAQTFILKSNDEKLTVVVNHFKSKGCGTLVDLDADQLDGQSCYNDTRKKQAAELMIFVNSLIASSADSDVVIMGDFNAYNEEDPLDYFRSAGMRSLLDKSYSYVFDGQMGALDHAFATKSLTKQMTGIDKWHINSTEPRIIDYTTQFKTQDLFAANPYRASDHDPLLIGFDLARQIPTGIDEVVSDVMNIYPNPLKSGDTLKYNLPAAASLINGLGVEAARSETNGEISTTGLISGIYMLHIQGMKPVKVILTQ